MKAGWQRYPLLEALLGRRSRRFARGFAFEGGPLAYTSQERAQPLSLEEEAALAFAACGISGHSLGDLPYQSGEPADAGGGNIMAQLVGRTVPSGDSLHTVIMFVLDDAGAWMLSRPQDLGASELDELIELARERRLTDSYRRTRVRVSYSRPEVPRRVPVVLPFNKWSSNLPGTTVFLAVNELSALYINALLSAFGEELAYFLVDERNRLRPAGLSRFARSRGGHLEDDPAAGRVATIRLPRGHLARAHRARAGGDDPESRSDG